jgi:AraC-like DNA-binding protein
MKQLRPIILFLHRNRLLIIIPLLACIFAFFWSEANKTLTICPLKKNNRTIQTYSDISDSGNSVISAPQITDNRIDFEFTLKKGNPYPYAGLLISLMKDSTFLDISKYNYLVLTLNGGNAKSIAIYMKAFIDGVTRLDQFLTHEFLMKEISVDSISSMYKISLNEFDHPSWWLEENNFVESNLSKPRFSKMIRMEIQNGISTPFDTPVKVSVEKISFVHNNSIALTLISGCTLSYFFIYALLFMVVQRKIKSKQTVISYKELVVENDSDKDMQRLMNAVARHFADPEFTVEKLAREAGVSASRIPGMLKERFNMNFKQYLNIIRITEAKRLLRETDNQITTCAYNVGYNNIPHFNRTFKQLEGISPKEYRKNPKERKPAEDTSPS